MKKGDALIENDPLHNILFSVHMYSSWNYPDAITDNECCQAEKLASDSRRIRVQLRQRAQQPSLQGRPPAYPGDMKYETHTAKRRCGDHRQRHRAQQKENHCRQGLLDNG